MNNRSLYIPQGRKNIYTLMNFGKSNYITGHHLRDSVETHKLEIGCGGPIFTNNFPALSKYIPPSCINHTWQFIKENIVIEQYNSNLQI